MLVLYICLPMYKCIFIIVAYLLPVLVQAQTVVEPEWLTIKDGLSQGYVRCMVQDWEGFLWMGTKNGLNRYDGEHFQVFTHDPSDPYSISADYISSLYEYGDFLLVGTFGGGLNLFYKKTKRFYKIPLTDPKSEPNAVLSIYNLLQDSLGQFWFTTEPSSRLFKLRFPDDFQKQDAPLEERLQAIEVSSNPKLGTIDLGFLVGYRDYVLIVKPDKKKIYQVDIRTGEADLFEHQIDYDHPYFIKSIINAKNKVLMRTDFYYENEADEFFNVLSVLEKGGWRPINTDFYTHKFFSHKKEHQDWIVVNAEERYLFFEEAVFDGFSVRTHDASFTFPNNNVANNSIINDHSDNTWIGTSGYGVMKLSPRLLKIKTYFKGKSIYAPPFATTAGEIFFHNKTTDECLYSPGDQPRLAKLYNEQKNTLKILEDRETNFWALHFYQDQYYLSQANSDGSLDHKWRIAPTGTVEPIISYESENNTILIASTTTGAFHIYHVDKDLMQTFDFQDFVGNRFELYAMAKTKNDHYWIGSSHGLIHAIPWEEDFAFKLLKKKEGDLTGLLNNQVASLLKDPEDGNILWIGTKGGGLHRLDTRDMTFSHVNSKNGLPNDVIYGILNDDYGNLWMSSNKGIIRYHPKTGQIRNFTEADGLQSDEFNTYAYYKTKDGTMLFGGINGLNVFHPDDLQDNPVTPEVWITGLEINNKRVTVKDSTAILDRAIEYTTEITLPFKQNSITLEFAALEYTAPSKNRFRYYLEGAEEEWVHEGTENIAPYLNLSPGTYTFKIKGSNGDGVWSERVRSLKINILPPWYRSTLAYIIYTVLTGLGIWRYQKFRENQLRLKHAVELEHMEAERLKELNELKSRFFTNISHEFRTPLTIISGMIDQIRNKPDQWLEKGTEMIRQNTSNLLNLVNQILDLRKLEAREMQPNYVQGDVVQYLRYIAESYRSLAESKGMRLHFLTTTPSFSMDYDPEKLLRIVSNLLSNAVKFTEAAKNSDGDIYLQLDEKTDKNNSFFIIRVEDTGAGIPVEKLPHIFDRFYQADDSVTRKGEGTGIGLALVNEMVKLLGGTIEVDSELGKGSVFWVKLPVSRKSEIEGVGLPTTSPVPGHPREPSAKEPDAQDATFLRDKSLPTLLIVEDNPDVQQFLIACLEDHYQLEVANNGQQGIDKAIEQVPDLIVSDVMMPEKDGFEVTEMLKQDERTSHIPIILLTAKAGSESKISGLKSGADAYLTKPFEPEELLVRLEKLLELRKKLQMRYAQGNIEVHGTPLPLSMEDEFVLKIRGIVQQNMEDENFGTVALCNALRMSRTQVHNKTKALTGKSTSLFIRSIRLQKAKELLQKTDLNVSEVGYEVGFSNPAYFSRIFHEEFGESPARTRK